MQIRHINIKLNFVILYSDLAIGAPNTESVFVYKSYPIVRLSVSVVPASKEIKTTDKTAKFTVCWSYNSPHPVNIPVGKYQEYNIEESFSGIFSLNHSRFSLGFNTVIKIDGQLNRATFNDKSNQIEFNDTASLGQKCRDMEISVTFSLADIFKPIDIEMTYSVTNQPAPDQQSECHSEENSGEPVSFIYYCSRYVFNLCIEFCDTCVVVNPADSKVISNKIVFNSGCKSSKCVADLRLSSRLLDVQK